MRSGGNGVAMLLNSNKQHLEICGNLVSLRDLIQATILSSGLPMVGYFIGPPENTTKQVVILPSLS